MFYQRCACLLQGEGVKESEVFQVLLGATYFRCPHHARAYTAFERMVIGADWGRCEWRNALLTDTTF